MHGAEHEGGHDQGDPGTHPGLEGPQRQPAEEELLDDRGSHHHGQEQQQDAAARCLVDEVPGGTRDVQVVRHEEQRYVDDRNDGHLGGDADEQALPCIPGGRSPAQVGPAHAPGHHQPERHPQQAGPEGSLEDGHHGEGNGVVDPIVADSEDDPGGHDAGHHPDHHPGHHVADPPEAHGRTRTGPGRRAASS